MQQAFVKLLEDTLVFDYYRGGNYYTVLGDRLRSHPHMVVGQVVGNDLQSYISEYGRLRVPDGSGYCTPAGVQRRTRNVGGRPAMFHWAHVNFYICNGIDLARLITFPKLLKPAVGKHIGRINRGLLELHEDTAQGFQTIAERKKLGMQLLEILLQGSDSGTTIDNEHMRLLQRMQPILEHMHHHISDPLQVQTLAKLFKLSFSRFHELFVTCTGMPPGHYQQQLRLRHAQLLLATSDRAINDIAADCGYDDNHYFSRIFKKHIGQTPSAWRRQYSDEQPI